jgi:hypothetical protein
MCQPVVCSVRENKNGIRAKSNRHTPRVIRKGKPLSYPLFPGCPKKLTQPVTTNCIKKNTKVPVHQVINRFSASVGKQVLLSDIMRIFWFLTQPEAHIDSKISEMLTAGNNKKELACG